MIPRGSGFAIESGAIHLRSFALLRRAFLRSGCSRRMSRSLA
jgi:hypothetical protein